MIKIEKVQGEEQRLYDLVAKLVMSRDVLKQNNHYPFWTSEKHVWFIARNEKDAVNGFFPVEISTRTAKINNYYVQEKNTSLMHRLIRDVIRTYEKEKNIRAVVLIQHVPVFEKLGFVPVRELRRYSIMEYNKA